MRLLLISYTHGNPGVVNELTGSHNEGEDFTPGDFRRTLDEFLSAYLPGLN